MFPYEISLNIGGGFPAERHPTRPQIAAIDGLVCYVVGAIATALGPFAGDSNIDTVIDDWNVDHSFEAAILVVAQIRRCHSLELIRGFCRCEIHDTRRRITAVECPLWTTQNLSTFATS